MDREISPPPTKRRKIEPPIGVGVHEIEIAGNRIPAKLGSASSEENRCIRMFTWNINGIQAFIPASEPSIKTFFQPVSPPTKTSSGKEPTPHEKESGTSSRGNPLRSFLRRHEWPEILFLQELKISPADKKTPSVLSHVINISTGLEDDLSAGTRYNVDFNLPRDKHNARGFGGRLYGVGTLLREDFAEQHVAEVRHADWDLEGRVTIVELRRHPRFAVAGTTDAAVQDKSSRDRRPLALLNIYAVNGTNSPYRSPATGKHAGTRHDHKIAFHARLRDECLDLERRGFSVIIAGDLNIARGTLDGHPKLRTFPRQHCVNRADFNSKFFGDEDSLRAEAYLREGPPFSRESDGLRFDGVDVFRALRGKERRYTYHPRGVDMWGASCDRVDFIVASRTLYDAECLVDTDILDSPQERGTSDHVPLWVKVKLIGAC